MPNALAALYSYGDGLKRKMNRLISDPAGTVDLGATRFAEDQNALQQLAANAGYLPGNNSVLQAPEQRDQARSQFADKALELYGGMLGTVASRGPAASAEWAGTNTPSRKGEAYAEDMLQIIRQDIAGKDFDPSMVRQGLVEWSQNAGIHPGHSLRAFMRQLESDKSITNTQKKKILDGLSGGASP
jgi:hypothetical protein